MATKTESVAMKEASSLFRKIAKEQNFDYLVFAG